MMNCAIQVRDLHVVRRGVTVTNGISVDIPQGAITGLLGPSGCGKTTLMRCVVGVQIVRAGTVTVFGLPAGSKGVRNKIGYATQNAAIYSDLTISEMLRYFASVLRAPESDVERVLAEVGLSAHADVLLGRLSGGMQSRANLAVALLGEPELLVLDEPTVGLDPLLRDELWDLFTQLAAQGKTLLVSSHVMDEAGRCDSLLLMREGEVLTTDTPHGLRRRTGEGDLERAFLRLIKDEEVAG